MSQFKTQGKQTGCSQIRGGCFTSLFRKVWRGGTISNTKGPSLKITYIEGLLAKRRRRGVDTTPDDDGAVNAARVLDGIRAEETRRDAVVGLQCLADVANNGLLPFFY